MADEKSDLQSQNPPATSPAPRPPRRLGPKLPPVLAFIVKVLEHWSVNLLHNIALGFLTFDSLVAAYRARGDRWTIAFVAGAYALLMLFFWCIRAFERATPARKKPLMIAVCALATLLVGLFSYRVSSMMPFGLAVAIWVLAGITMVAGFFAIFVFGSLTESGGGLNAGNEKAVGGEKAMGKEQQN